MRTLVVYDSLYGNTKTIAQTIGAAIPGEVEVVHVGGASASGLEAYTCSLPALRPTGPNRRRIWGDFSIRSRRRLWRVSTWPALIHG